MARHRFAGDLNSITLAVGPDGYTMSKPSAVRCYAARTGGEEIIDLTWDAAGALTVETPIVSAGVSDGSSIMGAFGPFYGPDGVWYLWASGDNAPRQLMVANDLPDYIIDALADALQAQTDATKGIGDAAKAQVAADKALANSGKFVQADPAPTWTITHAMPNRPGVTVVDGAGTLLYADCTYPDGTTIVLTFSEPTAGTAYLRG